MRLSLPLVVIVICSLRFELGGYGFDVGGHLTTQAGVSFVLRYEIPDLIAVGGVALNAYYIDRY